ncbi:TPA: DNA recombination protein RmuC [Candidatus Campbellbacteria bacterium]|jgi:DNA recombination protein RmuC|uniref:DNA recombination protein RmuC n=2 Tax=Candidatus Campbelliibacteriota TaxID=1752727 RepID=A0A1F5EPB4_9BACT|nr:MAG: hypothetical protein UR58_C0001G0526 [Candidatus Campbellbacteria bacterium GW2011_OD1_34_28]KKP74955.1 MAG: hypothetical protein UR74_C0002G0221 [Candidatus Campbellbacteria bacterium GW2011_GWD2_35_24]KKP75841.1 MAG: hypothetical protein UR75_C0002G0222 [Candidatus Campbellbacteria bacterium GW2011_GWC2_35_28]KKP76911.1 MAG: hypothetical protein UR76_C0002G0112 [Candidatus Campbellbacteria bacterium GW2011_GWC1_35_31]KKP78837.1 MAG: hypothetical protein UR79_C0002G0112 [Candidatus Cam
MEIILTALIILLVLAVAVMAYFLYKLSLKGNEKKDDNSFLLIQNQLNELTRTLDSRIGESSKMMNDSVKTQFSESQKLIKEITQELSSVKETSRQVVGFADQLKNLQDILKNPKQRGVLGEYYLETVLKNVLPPERFQMQYKFENGEIVDAVVFLDKNKFLPVDSKFSLENYNKIVSTNDPQEKERLEKVFKQDLKNRIDETAKYIRPKEGTMDFAFMFIPSEGIYYDLLINQVGAVKTSTIDLIEYAFQQKKVIIVSPTSFLAYLQTVLQGLRSLQIEEKAQDIIKRVGQLDKHMNNFGQFMEKLGSSLSTTVNHFNRSHKEFQQIDKDVLRITGESSGVESIIIDKPAID